MVRFCEIFLSLIKASIVNQYIWIFLTINGLLFKCSEYFIKGHRNRICPPMQ